MLLVVGHGPSLGFPCSLDDGCLFGSASSPKPTLSTVTGLFLGKLIGSGVSRDVYEYRPNPEAYVIKIERRGDDELDFQNIAEWELWAMASSALVKWLAPCVSISPCGGALMQARCELCPAHMIPKKVPSVLGDCHTGNFGIYKGKVVLMDYGRHLALKLTANAKSMRPLSGAT